jgi:DNA-binding response OmpR family regulator
MREMVARIHAVLRRSNRAEVDADVVRAADITLDRRGHFVVVGSRQADLTPSEFDLLAVLMSSPGRAFSRNTLIEQIQDGIAIDGVERTIDVHIRNLRTKIELDPSNPRYIETVYGVGYRFTTTE